MGYDGTDPEVDTRGAPAPKGVAQRSRGIWTFTADVDLLRRLAAAGFDWLAVDA